MIEKLVSLGLTSYEAKAYLALVSRGSSTAAETSRLAGLPRQRVYDVLGGLVERGLASTRPGKAVKYVATPPDVALELLLTDHRNRVATYERDAAALLDDLKTRLPSRSAPDRPARVHRGAPRPRGDQRALRRASDGINARSSSSRSRRTRRRRRRTSGLEVTRNHVVRTVYECSILEQPEMAKGVQRFIETGEEARFVDELPLKLVIIDEAIVLFGMEDPIAESDALTLLVIEHPSLAGMLKIGFEAVWQEGETYEAALARQEPPLAAARSA